MGLIFSFFRGNTDRAQQLKEIDEKITYQKKCLNSYISNRRTILSYELKVFILAN